MAVITWLSSPQNITKSPGVGLDAAWDEFDVSAYVPSGATGVILRIRNTQVANRSVGWRKNGSTDDIHGDCPMGVAIYPHVGVDTNRIFELYLEDGNDPDHEVHLLGYFDDSAVFLTNWIEKSTGAADTWTDVDISSNTGGDTALAAMVVGYTGTSTYEYAVRNNGSTDDPYSSPGPDLRGQATLTVGVDGSEIFESCRENITILKFYLSGYLKDNVTFYVNAPSVDPGSNSTWVTKSINASAIGAWVYAGDSDAQYTYGARKPGSGLAWETPSGNELFTAFVETDGSGQIETYRSSVPDYFYVMGYATDAGGAVSLSPNEAGLSLSAEQAGTAGHTPIAPAEAGLGLSAEQTGTVGHTPVAPDESALALLAEAGALSVPDTIAPDGAVLTLLAENFLTGGFPLLFGDETSGITAHSPIVPAQTDLTLSSQQSTLIGHTSIAPAEASVAVNSEQSTLSMSVDLSPNSASLSISADQASTTGQTPLNPADSEVGLLIEAGALTGHTGLNPASSTIDLSIEQGGIFAETVLYTESASLAVVAEAIALTGHTPLAPADSDLALSGGVANLSHNTPISPAEALLALAGGTPSTTANTPLVPADSLVLTVSSQPSFVTKVIPNGVGLSVAATEPAIDVFYSLAANNAVFSVTVEETVITGHTNLIPSDNMIAISGTDTAIVSHAVTVPSDSVLGIVAAEPSLDAKIILHPEDGLFELLGASTSVRGYTSLTINDALVSLIVDQGSLTFMAYEVVDLIVREKATTTLIVKNEEGGLIVRDQPPPTLTVIG